MAEIQRYSNAFWSHLDDLKEGQQIQAKVAKAEKTREQHRDYQQTADRKCQLYETPLSEMQIDYSNHPMKKNKFFNQFIDRYLVCGCSQLGFGTKKHLTKHSLSHPRARAVAHPSLSLSLSLSVFALGGSEENMAGAQLPQGCGSPRERPRSLRVSAGQLMTARLSLFAPSLKLSLLKLTHCGHCLRSQCRLMGRH